MLMLYLDTSIVTKAFYILYSGTIKYKPQNPRTIEIMLYYPQPTHQPKIHLRNTSVYLLLKWNFKTFILKEYFGKRRQHRQKKCQSQTDSRTKRWTNERIWLRHSHTKIQFIAHVLIHSVVEASSLGTLARGVGVVSMEVEEPPLGRLLGVFTSNCCLKYLNKMLVLSVVMTWGGSHSQSMSFVWM